MLRDGRKKIMAKIICKLGGENIQRKVEGR